MTKAPLDGESHRPDPGPAPTFATVFRAAVRQRGLSLERVRDRLHAQGISISLATLSYWQRGRSQPERASSLRAVDALETILNLPGGTLRSLLGPRRPRGRLAAGPRQPAGQRPVFDSNPLVEQVLGESFEQLNSDVSALVIHNTVRLDENRCIRVTSTHQVLRATRDGASRLTTLHTTDEATAEPSDVVVRCGKLGTVRFVPELRSTVVEILFGRRLVRNETAVIDYDIVFGPAQDTSTHYERNTRAGLREYLLHVCFHPAALPRSCHGYYREAFGAERRHQRRIGPDASHSAHILPARCPVGVHGISWEWPD
ncbi:helix-turn-helix domain-containing protein [Streptomyces sp. NPDC018031]|uniref:helix-turn-helix domain-containing protein n=1 Tax=Streptomyces sp. NPDC018031 TaxID=3365033 RepID=UPI0037B0FC5A